MELHIEAKALYPRSVAAHRRRRLLSVNIAEETRRNSQVKLEPGQIIHWKNNELQLQTGSNLGYIDPELTLPNAPTGDVYFIEGNNTFAAGKNGLIINTVGDRDSLVITLANSTTNTAAVVRIANEDPDSIKALVDQLLTTLPTLTAKSVTAHVIGNSTSSDSQTKDQAKVDRINSIASYLRDKNLKKVTEHILQDRDPNIYADTRTGKVVILDAITGGFIFPPEKPARRAPQEGVPIPLEPTNFFNQDPLKDYINEVVQHLTRKGINANAADIALLLHQAAQERYSTNYQPRGVFADPSHFIPDKKRRPYHATEKKDELNYRFLRMISALDKDTVTAKKWATYIAKQMTSSYKPDGTFIPPEEGQEPKLAVPFTQWVQDPTS